jgi:pimeloyl-ACP methyl ester carboxylesterase
LGATYAEMFPTHIRAMVLDGAANPAADPIQGLVDQGTSFNQNLDAFFADCAGNPSCAWKPKGRPAADYDALMSSLATHPLPTAGGRTLGPGDAYSAVALGLNDQEFWPSLAAALAMADAGNGSGLLQLSDQYLGRGAEGQYTNEFEANTAINCVDTPWPRDLSVIQRAADGARRVAPQFGAAAVYGEALACSVWPVAADSTPHAITAAGSPPIVVVGSTGDSASPYADSQALAGQLQHGVLVTRVGEGHTGYRSSACVRSHVDSYLIDLTVPPDGVRCPTP